MNKYAVWLESLERFKQSSSTITFKMSSRNLEVAPGDATTESIVIRRVGATKQNISLTRQEAEFVAASILNIYGLGDK